MQNESVQVELKNGTMVQGTILSVSPAMNINLKDVKMTSIDRPATSLEHITIRGNQVRMVLLPDELNLDSILQDPVFKPKSKKKLETTASKAPKRAAPGRSRGF